jgi:hypothetical protein
LEQQRFVNFFNFDTGSGYTVFVGFSLAHIPILTNFQFPAQNAANFLYQLFVWLIVSKTQSD